MATSRNQHSSRLFARLLGFFSFVILGAALGILGLSLMTAGAIYEYRDTVLSENLPPVDVIVCLSGGRGRIAASSRLWYRYYQKAKASRGKVKVPILYLSGLGSHSSWRTVSQQLDGRALRVIRRTDVVLETESSDTRENASWLLNSAIQEGWNRILLVTSSYHMKRAHYIFKQVLKTRADENRLKIDTYSLRQDPFNRSNWRNSFNGIRVTIEEYLKLVFYRAFF